MEKLNNRFRYGLITALVLIIISCESGEGSKEKKQIKTMEQTKQELKQELNTAIDNADKEIKNLQKEIELASEDAKGHIETAIIRIKAERQKVADKVDEVAKASEADLENLKVESNQIIEDAHTRMDILRNSVKELFSDAN